MLFYYILLYYIILILYYITLSCILLYSILLYCIILYYIILYYILYSILFYVMILYYIISYHIISYYCMYVFYIISYYIILYDYIYIGAVRKAELCRCLNDYLWRKLSRNTISSVSSVPTERSERQKTLRPKVTSCCLKGVALACRHPIHGFRGIPVTRPVCESYDWLQRNCT